MAIVDRLLHALLLERLAAVEADVAQHLRQRLEDPADLARPAAGAENDGQNLQGGDQAVAGRRVVAEDDVPRLLAADVEAVAAHVVDDVAVADLGALQVSGREPTR